MYYLKMSLLFAHLRSSVWNKNLSSSREEIHFDPFQQMLSIAVIYFSMMPHWPSTFTLSSCIKKSAACPKFSPQTQTVSVISRSVGRSVSTSFSLSVAKHRFPARLRKTVASKVNWHKLLFYNEGPSFLSPLLTLGVLPVNRCRVPVFSCVCELQYVSDGCLITR